MSRTRVSGVVHVVMVVACLLLASPPATAQQGSGITGLVQDGSGAVLPGVTVEVSSPALIEKVRSVVTDGQGRYSVTGITAGTYAVTFTLPGFRTVRREGIVLTTGFTASVNAEMSVGGLEETVIVSGATPLVDTTSVRGQSLVSNELLGSLPAASLSLVTVMRVTPGLVTGGNSGQDVGGSRGTFWGNSMSGLTFHGKVNPRIFFDGLVVSDFVSSITANNPARLEASGYFVNLATVEETAFESSGIAAESLSGGISMNSVPKSGSNSFSFRAHGMYGSGDWISGNLTDAQIAAGLANTGKITTLYTAYAALGGALKQDRVWFFAAPKRDYLYSEKQGPFNYNSMQGSPFYVPDPNRPSDFHDKVLSIPARLTWQASPKNKVNIFVDTQPYCGCPQTASAAADAEFYRKSTGTLVQASWSRPQNSRLLFEAAGGLLRFRGNNPNLVNSPNDIGIVDTTTGLNYNARLVLGLTSYGDKQSNRWAQRASVSYVTGSHNMKVGFQMDEGWRKEQNLINQSISYRFRGSTPGNATPLSLTLYATPYTNQGVQNADAIVYAQDRWTAKRLTVNAGLQFGYSNAYAPAQEVAATKYVPYVRSFAKVPNLPNYKDLNPRVGAAYDLFGDGRTALKSSMSRYTFPVGVGLALALNPLLTSVNSVTRTWNDSAFAAGDGRNGNYVPDCDLLNPAANAECGPWQNLNFGQTALTTKWDPRTTEGFGVRDGYWEITAEVQQQVTDRVSVSGGYFRNWQFGQRVVDNLSVTRDDFSPYSVVAPIDPRLPGGGGYLVSGLYDLNPNKVGQVNNVVVPASDYGKADTHHDFFNVNVQGRFGAGFRVGGGLDTGRSVTDTCFIVDTPQALLNCHQVTGFKDQIQARFFGTASLPRGFALSAIYSNTAGLPITADYTVTSNQIVGLGRNLSTVTAAVPLITPGAEFDKRNTVIDLQLSKTFQSGRLRLRPQIGFYNVLNNNGLATRVNTFGPRFGPSTFIPGRSIQFSGELTF